MSGVASQEDGQRCEWYAGGPEAAGRGGPPGAGPAFAASPGMCASARVPSLRTGGPDLGRPDVPRPAGSSGRPPGGAGAPGTAACAPGSRRWERWADRGASRRPAAPRHGRGPRSPGNGGLLPWRAAPRQATPGPQGVAARRHEPVEQHLPRRDPCTRRPARVTMPRRKPGDDRDPVRPRAGASRDTRNRRSSVRGSRGHGSGAADTIRSPSRAPGFSTHPWLSLRWGRSSAEKSSTPRAASTRAPASVRIVPQGPDTASDG